MCSLLLDWLFVNDMVPCVQVVPVWCGPGGVAGQPGHPVIPGQHAGVQRLAEHAAAGTHARQTTGAGYASLYTWAAFGLMKYIIG